MGFLVWRDPLFREMKQAYGLKRRNWKKRTARTPPYAGCYCTPDFWWEGDIRGHVITFWDKFRRGRFTGDIMVGAFDAWHNYTVSRSGNEVRTCAHAGCWEARLPGVTALAQYVAGQPAVESMSVYMKGLSIALVKADARVLAELLPLAATAVDELLQHQDSPLLKAVEAGDCVLAGKLLEAGADANEYGADLWPYGESDQPYPMPKDPLRQAIQRDDPDMVSLLIRHGAKWQDNHSVPLWIALQCRSHRALAVLLDAGLDPTATMFRSRDLDAPGIEHAARLGDPVAVKMLLDAASKRAGPLEFRVVNAARRAACGPQKAEIRALLETAPCPPRRRIAPRAVIWSVGSQAAAVAAILGGIRWSGENPRIAVYGFFVNYVFRLLTMGVFYRLHAKGGPALKQRVEKLTRAPYPGQESYPVTVTTNWSSGPGRVPAYVFLMICLFGFTFICVNASDGQFVTPASVVGKEFLWSVLMALIWWVQDLVERRIVFRFEEPLTVNLGYNSSETTIAALALLCGGMGSAADASGWPVLIVMLVIKHLMAVADDLRQPASGA